MNEIAIWPIDLFTTEKAINNDLKQTDNSSTFRVKYISIDYSM